MIDITKINQEEKSIKTNIVFIFQGCLVKGFALKELHKQKNYLNNGSYKKLLKQVTTVWIKYNYSKIVTTKIQNNYLKKKTT